MAPVEIGEKERQRDPSDEDAGAEKRVASFSGERAKSAARSFEKRGRGEGCGRGNKARERDQDDQLGVQGFSP